ncbi:hypothetical protein HPB47_020697 [Ixodes persulcatus]|uniref:Uncharacterized protein n=1 Tax=Ixodes persulcatus TaxID=34615 RepID=A0AC60QHY2_IXOPE|nr:hypothetical protein HPB47_020697 [Ixodes persulcatus]
MKTRCWGASDGFLPDLRDTENCVDEPVVNTAVKLRPTTHTDGVKAECTTWLDRSAVLEVFRTGEDREAPLQ